MSGMRLRTFALPAALVQAPAPSHEPYRPRFHFSPSVNWTNDPNGLACFDGEYRCLSKSSPGVMIFTGSAADSRIDLVST